MDMWVCIPSRIFNKNWENMGWNWPFPIHCFHGLLIPCDRTGGSWQGVSYPVFPTKHIPVFSHMSTLAAFFQALDSFVFFLCLVWQNYKMIFSLYANIILYSDTLPIKPLHTYKTWCEDSNVSDFHIVSIASFSKIS